MSDKRDDGEWLLTVIPLRDDAQGGLFHDGEDMAIMEAILSFMAEKDGMLVITRR